MAQNCYFIARYRFSLLVTVICYSLRLLDSKANVQKSTINYVMSNDLILALQKMPKQFVAFLLRLSLTVTMHPYTFFKVMSNGQKSALPTILKTCLLFWPKHSAGGEIFTRGIFIVICNDR